METKEDVIEGLPCCVDWMVMFDLVGLLTDDCVAYDFARFRGGWRFRGCGDGSTRQTHAITRPERHTRIGAGHGLMGYSNIWRADTRTNTPYDPSPGVARRGKTSHPAIYLDSGVRSMAVI